MAEPRFQRRKEERPEEITQAALEAFAEKGYAATRVDEVAKRAGVSKGLLYLYFKTKEDLFKAVIRSFVSPRVDALVDTIANTELSAEAFIRGPFLDFAKSVPNSPVKVLIRLMVAEGPKHPDLVQWYWDTVVSRAIKALGSLIEKGVRNGEFRHTALSEFPQLLVAPVLFSTIFTTVFRKQADLDTDRFIEAHVDLLLNAVRVKTT
ncbi:MAG: TetR/AcrR family transcriptional regulator [Woeseiaceae bacterium]|nr:TetR/AcrR family transcriptional regulator [Woeseiaceae bacterium]